MRYPSPAKRIEAVRRARKTAAETLLDALGGNGFGISERELCDRWLAGMAADKRLLPEGWYQPPPAGVSALIGHSPRFERMSYVSLRHQETWPRTDIQIGDESILYAYASPVEAATCMIGDFGVTLYRGSDTSIQEHLAVCIHITSKVVEFAAVGMELRELYYYASDLMRQASLTNETFSTTDASGGVDIGHTVPWSYDDYASTGWELLARSNLPSAAKLISSARVFLNEEERLRIQPTMAFTVEPRMSSDRLPMASFHVIVSFLESTKTVNADFGSLFTVSGMTEYLPKDALAILGCSAEIAGD